MTKAVRQRAAKWSPDSWRNLPIRQQPRCMSVPDVVEVPRRDAGLLSTRLERLGYAVGVDGPSIRGAEHEVLIPP